MPEGLLVRGKNSLGIVSSTVSLIWYGSVYFPLLQTAFKHKQFVNQKSSIPEEF